MILWDFFIFIDDDTAIDGGGKLDICPHFSDADDGVCPAPWYGPARAINCKIGRRVYCLGV